MKKRFKSPVVWSVIITVLIAQLQQLQEKGNITALDIAIAGLTVGAAVFGTLNNPTDKNNF